MLTSPKLLSWVENEALLKSLQAFAKWHHIERDLAMFSINTDDDYVPCLQGITRASFCNVYLEWIQHCAQRRPEVGGQGGRGAAGDGRGGGGAAGDGRGLESTVPFAASLYAVDSRAREASVFDDGFV